jgi:glycosyltransferase involved in cell wall biosynthesis
MKKKQVALVYDWVDKWGGVERLLLALHAMFPEAPLYTSFHNKQHAQWAKDFDIRPSYMQYLPGFIRNNRKFSVPFLGRAFEQFDFSAFDTVISVSSSFAKGIITKPEAQHIGIILTPTRYIWGQQTQYGNNGLIAQMIANDLRSWDYIAAQRPDKLIAISNCVRDRIAAYYRRDSHVVYPPFDSSYWGKVKTSSVRKPDDYYLVVSRLEPYKNVETVIDAFAGMPDKKLIVVGTGSVEHALRARAGINVTFTGYISDDNLADYYRHACGLIMPQEEDFGYVALEAQYFGCPVIAFASGGALETVLEDKTGIFYKANTAENLQNTVEKFHIVSYNYKNNLKTIGQEWLKQFEIKKFSDTLSSIISK